MKRNHSLQRRNRMGRRLTFELLENRRLLVSDWQNPLFNLDVDNDGVVAPLDALLVINQLNRTGFDFDFTRSVGEQPYIDVSGNLSLEPLDALPVINYLNGTQPTFR